MKSSIKPPKKHTANWLCVLLLVFDTFKLHCAVFVANNDVLEPIPVIAFRIVVAIKYAAAFFAQQGGGDSHSGNEKHVLTFVKRQGILFGFNRSIAELFFYFHKPCFGCVQTSGLLPSVHVPSLSADPDLASNIRQILFLLPSC